ncbi:MAG: FlgO family outer membrane protein [Acidobacteriota bacterium]|nr:FlgO family outer membrane protein [Acidobacteriota bacterium]MDH3530063.1 FlgO family outer membrane protein [Acidobacteriota bacterium]
MKIEPNTAVSHYKILSEIGKGGMGEVYLALDMKLDRNVAIKFLSDKFSKDTDKLNRFVQEAKAASALNHPNILTIHEIGEIDGVNYIATEFIDGKDLSHFISENKVSLESALDISIQIVSALKTAHEAGIVHRDIKPDNAMVRKDGIVKLLDFGLAKLSEKASVEPADLEVATIAKIDTVPGVVMGTPNYMSPEQARGKDIDHQTDIFSFGVVLYEMLTRKLPFQGDTTSDIIASILTKEPTPIKEFNETVPDDLKQIVTKSLKKDKNERYQNASDLLEDLKALKKRVELDEELERTILPGGQETKVFQATTAAEVQNMTANDSRVSVSLEKSSVNKLLLAFAGVLLITAVGVGYWFFGNSRANQINSIAVMPFVNETENKNIEYLSDGMTETLINSLSQLPDISVKARSSVFRYKGKEFDLKKIASELNVEAILTGRIVQRGEEITLNLELIDPQSETTIWGNKYVRKSSELVTLQTEIARHVSSKLKPKLSGEDERKLTKEYTENPEAFEAYLKGRFYWEKRTGDNLKQGIISFNQAIELDPNYALAWSGLADSYSVLAFYTSTPGRETNLKARAAAEKAVALDPELAEARTSLAETMFHQFDITGAEKEFKAAIKLNPKYATARQWYGQLLMVKGDLEGALREAQKASELEPFSAVISQGVGEQLYHLGRDNEAIAQFRETFEIDRDFGFAHRYLGYVLARQGKYDEALSEMKKAAEQDSIHFAPAIGYVYALSGETQKAREILRREMDRRKREGVVDMHIATIYVALGEKEKAIESLEELFREKAADLAWIKAEPVFVSLRDEPRYTALLKKIGFPE